MIKAILAIVFVLTAGSLFSRQFRNSRYLVSAAGAAALISAYYLALAIRDDVSNIKELVGTIREEEPVLTGLPEAPQPPASTFDYQIERNPSEIVATFPKESIDYLIRNADHGDLAGAMFSVLLEPETEAVCQHFIPYSAPSPSDLGIRELGTLIERLDCGVWRLREGGSSRASGMVRARYNRNNMSLNLSIAGKAVASMLNDQDETQVTFKVGFPTAHHVAEQRMVLK